MELAMGGLILASAVQVAVAVVLWTEVRGFRQLNAGLGAMIMEIETAQQEMRAGVIAAIHERAMADQAPEDKARAH
jgi:hypothetical protein